jgi:saxitoxin biosynthesis operon SxtJ-like protein
MIAMNWDPSRRVLRQFAGVGAVFLAGAATVAHLRGRGSETVVALAALAIALGVTAWLRPRRLRLPYVLLSLLAFPIGTAISHVILLVLFYGVMTPLGMIARLIRPDPLGIRRDRQVQSYWQARSRPRDPQAYLRQA